MKLSQVSYLTSSQILSPLMKSCEDGYLMIMTHIDPVFLLIPILQAVELVSTCEASQIFVIINVTAGRWLSREVSPAR